MTNFVLLGFMCGVLFFVIWGLSHPHPVKSSKKESLTHTKKTNRRFTKKTTVFVARSDLIGQSYIVKYSRWKLPAWDQEPPPRIDKTTKERRANLLLDMVEECIRSFRGHGAWILIPPLKRSLYWRCKVLAAKYLNDDDDDDDDMNPIWEPPKPPFLSKVSPRVNRDNATIKSGWSFWNELISSL